MANALFSIAMSIQGGTMSHPAAIQELIRRYPLLSLIGHTPLVPVPLFQQELPQADLLVKCEFLNPGGSVKDRSVLRMLTEAVISGALPQRRRFLTLHRGTQTSPMP
jgi:hypothetical protein